MDANSAKHRFEKYPVRPTGDPQLALRVLFFQRKTGMIDHGGLLVKTAKHWLE